MHCGVNVSWWICHCPLLWNKFWKRSLSIWQKSHKILRRSTIRKGNKWLVMRGEGGEVELFDQIGWIGSLWHRIATQLATIRFPWHINTINCCATWISIFPIRWLGSSSLIRCEYSWTTLIKLPTQWHRFNLFLFETRSIS